MRTLSITSAPLGGNFRKLWLATAISNLGDGIRDTALPLFAAVLTRDPMAVAGVAFANRMPWLLCSLVSGAMVDRFDRRRVMLCADGFRALLMAALVAGALTGRASITLLVVVAFGLGVAETLFDNAAHAVLPGLVSRDKLEHANGKLESAMLLGNYLLGPALGGVLFAALTTLPFMIDGISFAAAALLVMFLRGRFRPQLEATGDAPRTSLRAEIVEGVRWLYGHRLLRSLCAMAAIGNVALHATYATFVLFSLNTLGLDEVGFGILMATEGVGSLLGAMIAARVRQKLGTITTVATALGLAAAANLAIGASSSPLVVGTMMLLLCVSGVIWSVITTSLRQSLVPDRLLGRVNSAHRFVSWGAIPLGVLVGGAVGTTFGLRAPFFVAGAILALLALASPHLIGSKSRTVRVADSLQAAT